MLIHLFFFYIFSKSGNASNQYHWNTKGLSPERQSIYEQQFTSIDNIIFFKCFNGQHQYVSIDNINDDYCDCFDGSDEPGTSACSGVKGSPRFWCQNLGHFPKEIPRWKVEDDICDCCDGSDEKPNTCINTCQKVHQEWEAIEKERKKEEELGRATCYSMHNTGLKRHKSQTIRLKDLQTNIIPNLNSKLENLTQKLYEAEAAALKDEEANTLLLKKNQSQDDSTLSSKESLQPQEDDVSDNEEDENIDTNREKPSDIISEYAQWMEDGNNEERQDDQYEHDKIIHMEKEKLLPESKPVTKYLYNFQELKTTLLKHFQQSFDFFESRLHKLIKELGDLRRTVTQGHLIETVIQWSQSFQKRYNQTTRQVDTLKKEISDVNDALIKLNNEVHNMETEMARLKGFPFEYWHIYDTCYKLTNEQFTYEVCLFTHAKQTDTSGTSNHLGDLNTIQQDPENNQIILDYRNGAHCWKAPNRSIKILITCGAKTQLNEVKETDRCVYIAKMSSPIACFCKNNDEQEHNKDEESQLFKDEL